MPLEATLEMYTPKQQGMELRGSANREGVTGSALKLSPHSTVKEIQGHMSAGEVYIPADVPYPNPLVRAFTSSGQKVEGMLDLLVGSAVGHHRHHSLSAVVSSLQEDCVANACACMYGREYLLPLPLLSSSVNSAGNPFSLERNF